MSISIYKLIYVTTTYVLKSTKKTIVFIFLNQISIIISNKINSKQSNRLRISMGIANHFEQYQKTLLLRTVFLKHCNIVIIASMQIVNLYVLKKFRIIIPNTHGTCDNNHISFVQCRLFLYKSVRIIINYCKK